MVLDTNVLISGLMYPASTPGRIVRAWHESRFELVMSKAQLTEIARVLTYPKIQRVLRWKRDRIERLLKQVYLRSVMVETARAPVATVPRDRHDMPLLQALVAARADWLVTGDGVLLALREEHPIATPAEFAAGL